MNLATIKDKIIEGVNLLIVQPTMYFINKIEEVTEDQYTAHRVSPLEKGRIDLIAIAYYGDASRSDLILKFNNISDPFSIAEGEVLKIPVYTFPYKRLERLKTVDENIVKQQFVDTKRLSKKDQNRIEALKAKYDKDVLLPPNVVPVGKRTFMFKGGGKVSFGAKAQADPVVDAILNKQSKTEKFSDKVVRKNART